MKIKEISIRGYRGITEMTLNPERINVFIGECGSGKSSVLEALRFALGGKAEKSDISTTDNEANEATVTVVFEDGSSISRTRKEDGITCKCNGKNASAKAVNEFLRTRCGVESTLFDALSSVDYFRALSKKDLTELFLSILPVQINFDAMIKLIEQQNAKPVTEKERTFLQKRFPAMPAQFSLDAIDKAYKDIYNLRKKVNADLKAVTARCVFDEQTLPDEKKEHLETALYNIAKKEADYRNHSKAVENYNRAVKIRTDAQKRLESLRKAYESYKDVVRPDESILKKAKSNRTQFQDAVNQSNRTVATLNSNMEMLNRTLANLDKPVCPISEKLTCTTDKSGVKNELIALIGQNSLAVKEQNDFIKRCEEQIARLDRRIEKYQQNVIAFNQKQSYEKQIKEFIIPELPEKPAEITAVDFTKEKEEINRKISILASFEMVKKYRQEKLKIQEDSSLCEFGAQALDIKYGVRSLILKQALIPFERLCNQKAQVLRDGFQIKITCEEGIEFLVKPHDADAYGFIPMSSVSTGEFVFVAYLMMSVIQAVTGGKYLVIDNLDRLDAKCVKSLMSLIADDKAYEHVFLGTVDHTDTIEAVNQFNGIERIFMS